MKLPAETLSMAMHTKHIERSGDECSRGGKIVLNNKIQPHFVK